MTDTDLATDDCIQHGDPESPCRGAVHWHSIDPGRSSAHPRCEKHWAERLERRENSIERYADSDIPPSWFDPSYAGERWHDDDHY